ncbi:DUF5117 domain-containing protein [Mucilaginibacter conchicola]|uniref:DUF5117 domain-containing protein n=1 Tax=Mucilaginibacter conchicola TaxID=2303333 RepID=A0A372NPR2_9SPHI|nr:zinc-dependent metalloprotease [Mucilaginibacter conchicola]RFZ90929.1 DUF5117 domain-containing protein [Mucilaginibacter conchicola]
MKHNIRIKHLLLIFALAMLVAPFAGMAQTIPGIPDNLPLKLIKKDTARKDTAKAVVTKLKPYTEVVSKNFRSKPGLFTVHQSKDSLLFEIPDSILSRQILFIQRLTQASYGINAYTGENMGSQTIVFEKGPDSTLLIQYDLAATEATPASNISKAVQNANLRPTMAILPIAALGRAGTSYVVDVTGLIKQKGFLTDTKFERDTSKHADNPKDYQIDYLHAYPLNVEIGVSHNLTLRADKVPVSMQVNASFLMLPRAPMMRRYDDERIGYFSNSVLPFSDDQQRVKWKRFITRWRLEPRKQDQKKWEQGQLVEPLRPIVIYLDPATPAQWRPFLIQSINDWQKAFEQAGFKNAIVGKEWPAADTTMHMDDARYSFIDYIPSDGVGSYPPEIHDPRSGEILQVHIGWNAGLMKQLHDNYMIQAGINDQQARKASFDVALMGRLIRYAASHEVGHSLGLRHNYGSSSRTPVNKLRDKKYLAKYGHTASIMDFARFNYVAQPQDGVTESGILPRIGEYDTWAIEWGYKNSGANNADADQKIMRQLANRRLTENKRLWFGDGESKDLKFDPRAQVDDMGDDPIQASLLGINNLKKVLPYLPKWTLEDGRSTQNLSEVYEAAKAQYLKYMAHVLKYTSGATYRNNIAEGQKAPVFVSAPLNVQKQALSFFNREIFTAPVWLLNPEITNRVTGVETNSFIDDLRAKVINSLLDARKLAQIRNNMERFPKETLPLNQYLSTIHGYVWNELKGPGNIKEDAYRRNLQKGYYGALLDVLSRTDNADDSENDAISLIKADLKTLATELKRAIPRAKDPLTRYHFQDMQARIQSTLNNKEI